MQAFSGARASLLLPNRSVWTQGGAISRTLIPVLLSV
jgi:hypothetical protein